MFKHLKDFLDFRLLSLSGGVLTPGSILIAVAIALLAVAVASVVGRWLRRALNLSSNTMQRAMAIIHPSNNNLVLVIVCRCLVPVAAILARGGISTLLKMSFPLRNRGE